MLVVMTGPVNIRRPDVVNDIRELPSLKSVSLTVAVAGAVKAELVRARETDTRRQDIRRLVEELHELPRIGPPLTDDDLYDEDGFPR